MLWIDELTACTDTTASATVRFADDHFAVTDGQVSEMALIECVAQTVAAALGHRSTSGGEMGRAQNGMLCAVSSFLIHSPLPLGKSARIEVRELKRLGPMLLVAGVVSCEGQQIAVGELAVYA
jgi:predicted hotdog family 3-hydroxylacyl-ACP dehydratase